MKLRTFTSIALELLNCVETPLRLKDLARRVVLHGTVQGGVTNLGLPVHLESYVLFNDPDDGMIRRAGRKWCV